MGEIGRLLMTCRCVSRCWRRLSGGGDGGGVRRVAYERIRNFAIIAHVDHGKSTLADRLLEETGTTVLGTHQQRLLDNLEVEKERGITVKSQTAAMQYKSEDGKEYTLNLIDTPGHIDFNFEVSRSLSAIEGVVLLVDANEGVQAQTIGNFFMAFEKNLAIIPVLNKIDLKGAVPELVTQQLFKLFDTEPRDVIRVSAKLGTGVKALLEAVVRHIPPPVVHPHLPLKALAFDSIFIGNKGYRCSVVLKSGSIAKGSTVKFFNSEVTAVVREVGVYKPECVPVEELTAGLVGYIIISMKSAQTTTSSLLVGDTVFDPSAGEVTPIVLIEPPKPLVHAGIYPDTAAEISKLHSALQKLLMNDSSVSVHREQNMALGQGWRLGFLGVLHMEIFLQRLEQEFGAHPVVTLPTVSYRVRLKHPKHIKDNNGDEMLEVSIPNKMPERLHVAEYFEPTIRATVICPVDHLDTVLTLVSLKRATNEQVSMITDSRYMITCTMPLAEVITDFNDNLKRATSGLASFDYEEAGFVKTDVSRVDLLLNGKAVEEFSFITHNDRLHQTCREMVDKLVEHIPRQLFEVSVQACVERKVIAKGRIKQYRKDVFQKLHGSIGTERRRMLLAAQREGKKRLRMVGQVEIPKKVFIEVFRTGSTKKS